MKDKYREETNKDVYSNDMCCGCGGSDGSYSDEYVKWLESEVKKLHIQNVSNCYDRTDMEYAYNADKDWQPFDEFIEEYDAPI